MLFQKNQTGYQGYRNNGNPNRSKVKALLVLAALTIIVVVLGLLLSPKKDGISTITTNELEDYTEVSFSISKPTNFSSSKVGEATVFKASEDKSEDPEYFSVEKYAKTSSNITPEVLKNSSLKDSTGKDIKNIKSELKKINDAEALSISTPQENSSTNKKVYVFGKVNVWLIYFHTRNGSVLQKSESRIIESFTLKRSDGDLNT